MYDKILVPDLNYWKQHSSVYSYCLKHLILSTNLQEKWRHRRYTRYLFFNHRPVFKKIDAVIVILYFLFFESLFIFINLKGKARNCERELSIHWFTSQMAAIVGAASGQSQEPGTASRTPVWV